MRNRQKKWHPYKSGLEAAFARSMKDKGIEFRYEPETLQYRRRVVKGICDTCGGSTVAQRRTYLPDFVLGGIQCGDSNDSKIYIETKGRLTAPDRAKMVAVKQDNPELDIRLVFGANNKVNKNKNERYSDWAERHGFPYHIGADFPPAWLQSSSSVRVNTNPRPVRGKAKGT